MTEESVKTEAAAAPAGWWQARLAAMRATPLAHGLLLGLFSLLTALILTLVDQSTRGPIADRGAEDLAASLAQVVPDELHDNDLTAGPLVIEDPETGPLTVYRAEKDGAVTGVVFTMVGYGYSGRIEVLLGVDRDGRVLGARVLSHAETPGLGDRIETSKSDWILKFTGLSLGNPAPEAWKVKRDGGQFDQFSGATITPRAVVGAIRRGLEFYGRNSGALLATGSAPSQEGM